MQRVASRIPGGSSHGPTGGDPPARHPNTAPKPPPPRSKSSVRQAAHSLFKKMSLTGKAVAKLRKRLIKRKVLSPELAEAPGVAMFVEERSSQFNNMYVMREEESETQKSPQIPAKTVAQLPELAPQKEEPKAEEPKAEEPKAEEPKAEEPNLAEKEKAEMSMRDLITMDKKSVEDKKPSADSEIEFAFHESTIARLENWVNPRGPQDSRLIHSSSCPHLDDSKHLDGSDSLLGSANQEEEHDDDDQGPVASGRRGIQRGDDRLAGGGIQKADDRLSAGGIQRADDRLAGPGRGGTRPGRGGRNAGLNKTKSDQHVARRSTPLPRDVEFNRRFYAGGPLVERMLNSE